MRQKSRVSPWLLGLSALLLLLSSCRDHQLLDWVPGADGMGSSPSVEMGGGIGGEAGQDVRSEPPNEAGSSASGTTTNPAFGGGAGEMGTSVGGNDAEAGAAGGAAGQGGPGEPGPASMLGTVFIQTDTRTCAGTLQTNAWVLTSGNCVLAGVSPDEITVLSGTDRLHPFDTVGVTEIIRFSETDSARAPALLRLARPLEVDGSTSGFLRTYYPLDKLYLEGASLYCLGWDMSPSPGAATTIQSSLPRVASVEQGTIPGTAFWLLNERETGRITQAADEGGGCFVSMGLDWSQVAVLLENPSHDREGLPNGGAWGRASSLTDSSMRNWMLSTMMGRATVPGIVPSRGVNTVQQPEGGLAVVWLDATGAMLRAPLDDPTEQQDLGSPPGVDFVAQRPGAALFGDQTIVVAYGSDHQLWYRKLGLQSVPAKGSSDSVSEIGSGWAVVESAVAPSTPAGLVSVGGTVHLFALGVGTEVRQAIFSGGPWQQWNDLGGGCKGAPTASSWGADRIDILVRGPDDYIWQRPYDAGSWRDYAETQGASPSDPLVIDPGGFQVDLFMQDHQGRLRLRWNTGWNWLNEWLDPGIPAGRYLGGVSAVPGSYDLLTSDGGELTHLWWPR